MHDFPTLLTDRSKFEEFALRIDVDADLFLEFPQRSIEKLFAGFDFPFGNRPMPVVAMGEEGAARVGQENLQLASTNPEHQQSGADSRPHSLIVLRVASEPSG